MKGLHKNLESDLISYKILGGLTRVARFYTSDKIYLYDVVFYTGSYPLKHEGEILYPNNNRKTINGF
jgi:hypothetical protein